MDLLEMYKITTRASTVWGIDGYEVPRKYADPIKMSQDKKIEELLKAGKSIPPEKKLITKRGSYLDDELKMKNPKVGPSLYPLKDIWVISEEEKKRVKPKPGKRQTYIDEIFSNSKKRGVPGK